MADAAARLGADQVTDTYAPPIPDQVRRGQEMQARVRALLPIIAANAEKAEADRKVPDENIRLLKEAGFTRSLQPLVYGGLELSPEQYCPMIVELARACASTAWVAACWVATGAIAPGAWQPTRANSARRPTIIVLTGCIGDLLSSFAGGGERDA